MSNNIKQREDLLYKLTGTYSPKFMTERENVMIDKFIEILNEQPIVEQDKEEDWAGVYNYTDKKQDKDIDTLAKEFASMKLGSDRKYLDTVGKDRFDCIVIGYKANTVNKELLEAAKRVRDFMDKTVSEKDYKSSMRVELENAIEKAVKQINQLT